MGLNSRCTALSRTCFDKEPGLSTKCLAQIHILCCRPPTVTPNGHHENASTSRLLSGGEEWKNVGRDCPLWSLTFMGLLLTKCWYSHLTSLAWKTELLPGDIPRQTEAEMGRKLPWVTLTPWASGALETSRIRTLGRDIGMSMRERDMGLRFHQRDSVSRNCECMKGRTRKGGKAGWA